MTMTTASKIAMAALILLTTRVALACDYPSRAQVPNGATADEEEMLVGQRSVKAYMAAMDEYLACLEREEKVAVAALGDPSEDELTSREAAVTKKHNAAVEEMELTAARYNEAVRSYKEQSE